MYFICYVYFYFSLMFQGELGGGSSSKQKTEENKELKDIREKANAASLKLATAAKEAETNIK